jgi:hypothetical protein
MVQLKKYLGPEKKLILCCLLKISRKNCVLTRLWNPKNFVGIFEYLLDDYKISFIYNYWYQFDAIEYINDSFILYLLEDIKQKKFSDKLRIEARKNNLRLFLVKNELRGQWDYSLQLRRLK